MKKIQEKKSLIINSFILLQPILDFITGIQIHHLNSTITLGMIVRILFLFFMIVMLFSQKTKNKKKIILYILLIGIYAIFFTGETLWIKGQSNLFKELSGLVKVFYFPLLLGLLYEEREEIKIEKKTLQWSLMIYLLLIWIPMILNIGYETYEITKKGNLGFFHSANEISGILSILTPILLLEIVENKKKEIIFLIIYLIVILNIGTKTPLLALGITLFFSFIFLSKKLFTQKKYKEIIKMTICLVGTITILVILIPQTNFYKNIKTHLNFLKVDQIEEVWKDEQLIDHFIFSQRLTFLKNKKQIYQKSSRIEKLIGIGYINEGKETKMIEMDYFDIYYSQGIVGFLLVFIPYLWILLKLVKQKENKTYQNLMLEVSLILILVLSLFTGHIITAPSVSILVVAIILLLNQEKEREKLR